MENLELLHDNVLHLTILVEILFTKVGQKVRDSISVDDLFS